MNNGEKREEKGNWEEKRWGGMDNQLWTQRDPSSDYCNLVHE